MSAPGGEGGQPCHIHNGTASGHRRLGLRLADLGFLIMLGCDQTGHFCDLEVQIWVRKCSRQARAECDGTRSNMPLGQVFREVFVAHMQVTMKPSDGVRSASGRRAPATQGSS